MIYGNPIVDLFNSSTEGKAEMFLVQYYSRQHDTWLTMAVFKSGKDAKEYRDMFMNVWGTPKSEYRVFQQKLEQSIVD